MGKSSIEECIMSYCIKYQNLSDLISTVYSGSNATRINIIFDMYSIYQRLLSSPDFYEIGSDFDITTSVFNLCAHYRAFFKYYGIDTIFHIVSSFNISEVNRVLCKGYNMNMVNCLDNTVNNRYISHINKNIDILGLISDYLPGIYFHKTSFESGVVMEHIILNSEDPSIILTKDPYLLQLVNLRPDTVIFRPFKPYSQHGNDCSYFVNQDPIIFWNNYCKLRKIQRFDRLIPPMFINIVDGVSGIPWRHIRWTKSVLGTMKQLIDLISSNKISSSKIDVISILEGMNIEPTLEKVNTIKAIDLNFQYEVYKNSPEFHMFKMNDLYDTRGLQMINEKYLGEELDLQRL